MRTNRFPAKKQHGDREVVGTKKGICQKIAKERGEERKRPARFLKLEKIGGELVAGRKGLSNGR